METKKIIKSILKANHGLERESVRLNLFDNSFKVLSSHDIQYDKEFAKNITLDFADNQVELVTEPFNEIEKVYQRLIEIHQQVIKHLPNNEYLWNFSIPPLYNEQNIQIAKFKDNYKLNYRKNLAERYGKNHQLWTGIHYNFSFATDLIEELYDLSDKNQTITSFKDELYLKTARNFLRNYWLIPYLFGASPKITDYFYKWQKTSYLKDYAVNLTKIKATSLRCSHHGYATCSQKKILLLFQSVAGYLNMIKKAATTHYQPFAKLKNSNIIQDERELYIPIRLKSLGKNTNYENLQKNGVSYLEIRCLDINPISPYGIDKHTMYFLHLFMLLNALTTSPLINQKEYQLIKQNEETVSLFGRLKNSKIANTLTGEKYLIIDAKKLFFNKLQSLLDSIPNQNLMKDDYQYAINKINNQPILAEEISTLNLNEYFRFSKQITNKIK